MELPHCTYTCAWTVGQATSSMQHAQHRFARLHRLPVDYGIIATQRIRGLRGGWRRRSAPLRPNSGTRPHACAPDTHCCGPDIPAPGLPSSAPASPLPALPPSSSHLISLLDSHGLQPVGHRHQRAGADARAKGEHVEGRLNPPANFVTHGTWGRARGRTCGTARA
eukprot:358480-Chlamydomonas_euryale.AAC.11